MKQKYQNLIKAVEKSGTILLKYFNGHLEVRHKSSEADFCTQADLASEASLIKFIKREFPDYNIYSEEAGKIDNGSLYEFVIDPLDGTFNFSLGISYFSVTVGLFYKNEVIFGVTHNPVTGQTYWAEKGKGAFLNRTKIKVNNKNRLDKSVICEVAGYHTSKIYLGKLMQKFMKADVMRLMTNWACALDYCLLACGKIEGIVNEDNFSFDFAAGKLIMKEAGVKITDFKGKPLKNDREIKFVASNGKIHHKLLSVLK